MGIEVALALSEKEKRDSFWVRHEVFAKEGGWIPTNNEEQEYDKYDFSSRAYHLVAYDEGKPVGTVRVLMHDPEIAKEDETRGGLHIEKSFRIDYSGPIDKVIDLSRSSVLRSHRSKNVLASLYAKAVRLVGDFVVEQILGGANPSTNSVEEANLMLSFAKMGCYYSDKISLHPLCTDQTKEPHLYYDLDTSEKLKRIVKENDLYEFFEKYFPPIFSNFSSIT